MDDYMWESILEALPPKRTSIAILLYELRHTFRSKYRSPLINKEKGHIELSWRKDGVGNMEVRIEDWCNRFTFRNEDYDIIEGYSDEDGKLDEIFISLLGKILE